MDYPAAIKNFVDSQQNEMLALLEQLVCAESPTLVPAAQQSVQVLLRKKLEQIGCMVFSIPGRTKSGGHIYARPRKRNPRQSLQLIVGHCDTVWPLGTLEKMPFSVEDNVIRGPGVYDMKGGLVQCVFALKSIAALGLKPSVLPILFINSDEEIGSPESNRHIKKLAKRVSRAFILEPALGPTGMLKTARKGAGRFVIEITGYSAHAGLNPGAGASAILELSNVIQRLYALNDASRGITINVGQVEGGVRPNVVAPTSKAVIDVRVQNQEDGTQIEEVILGLKATTPDTSLKVIGSIGRLPMELTPRNRTLWQAAKKAGEALGINLEEGTAGGVSDGNTTSQFTATLDGLGAVGDGAHAPHEFLYIDKMIERTKLLAMLLMLPLDLKTVPASS